MSFYSSRAGTLAVAALVCANAFAQERALSYDQALQAALERAPIVVARRAAAEGAAAAQVSADTLPDPRLNLGVENLPITGDERFSLDDDSMTMRKIGVMQEVPNRAKRKARAEAAAALTQRERALLLAERQLVRRQAALAWLSRHYAERRLAIFPELERENRVLQETVNARVTAGRALPAESTMARLDAVELAVRRDELERERAQAQAALRRWVGEAAEAPLVGEAKLPAIDVEHLRKNIGHHVELAQFDPMVQMAAAEAREAQAGKRPDWAWEVSYAKRGSQFSDMVSLEFSIDLPLFTRTRQNPRILAKRKEVQRIEAEREEMLREHQQMVETQLAQQQELTRQLGRLREDALPLAEERARLLMASYRGGRADLAAVLTARRDRVETQLKAMQIEGQLQALRAQLAYLFSEEQP